MPFKHLEESWITSEGIRKSYQKSIKRIIVSEEAKKEFENKNYERSFDTQEKSRTS